MFADVYHFQLLIHRPIWFWKFCQTLQFFFHLNYVSRYQFSSILFPWVFHMISSYSQGSNGLLFSLRHYFDITCVKDIYRRVISGFLSFSRVPERFNHWLSSKKSFDNLVNVIWWNRCCKKSQLYFAWRDLLHWPFDRGSRLTSCSSHTKKILLGTTRTELSTQDIHLKNCFCPHRVFNCIHSLDCWDANS